jgi:ADP-ribosyl-[dinitrogen reductase] hydrolase
LAIHYAGESSRTTHGAPAAVDACKFYAALILGALGGASKEELLGPLARARNSRGCRRLVKQKNPPVIAGTGYVVKSLEAALWAFYRSNTFEKGAVLAANLGDDADTTAAIFGQLAGAFYGVDAIPAKWLAKLATRELIEQMADNLLALSAREAATQTRELFPDYEPKASPGPEDEEEMEKAAALKYGIDLEADRRRWAIPSRNGGHK